MGRSCFVCLSIHRAEYEKMKLDNPSRSVKDIWRYSQRHYKEEIPYPSFKRHFREHIEGYVKAGIDSSILRRKKIEEEIYKDIEAAKILREHLEICSQQLVLLKDKMNDPVARKEMRDIIFKSDRTLELILRFLDKINIKPKETEEDVFNKIISCLKEADFTNEQMLRFAEIWRNYDVF